MPSNSNIVFDFDWHLSPWNGANGTGVELLGYPKNVTSYGTIYPNVECLGCFDMQSNYAQASTPSCLVLFHFLLIILCVLGEIQWKSDYISREVRALNLQKREALAIELNMGINGLVSPPSPAEFSPLCTPSAPIFGNDSYAEHSQTLPRDSGGHGKGTSNHPTSRPLI
ncbi:hypothetical protein F5887DRAFT_1088785 [Amanita rubescens]|nr:hypothetical protein F5887DRAFT_1088785 [Amanita rubescens]